MQPIFQLRNQVVKIGFFIFGEKMSRIKVSKKGFTLIEVMVAIGIFAIAVFGTLALIGQSISFGKHTHNQTIAANEAKRVLENVRRVADASGLATVASNNFNETLNSSLLQSGTVTVTDLSGNSLVSNADPLPVRVTVSWTQKGQATTYKLDTMVTQR